MKPKEVYLNIKKTPPLHPEIVLPSGSGESTYILRVYSCRTQRSVQAVLKLPKPLLQALGWQFGDVINASNIGPMLTLIPERLKHKVPKDQPIYQWERV